MLVIPKSDVMALCSHHYPVTQSILLRQAVPAQVQGGGGYVATRSSIFPPSLWPQRPDVSCPSNTS